MSLGARVVATLVGLLGAALLVAGSQLPWRAHPPTEALVRLSWRTSSRPVEECRTATPEELAALPAHMRLEKVCERRHAAFRLTVDVDGARVRDAVIEPAGASGDRPLYVFEELAVPPGPHRVSVAFEEEAAGARTEPSQGALAFDAALELAPGEIALVTLADSGERLVALVAGK